MKTRKIRKKYQTIKHLEESKFINPFERVHKLAVSDLATLREEGAIIGWEVADPWPISDETGRPKKILHDYHKPYQVQEVIDYFLNGCAKIAQEFCGNTVNQERMINALDSENNDLLLEYFSVEEEA